MVTSQDPEEVVDDVATLHLVDLAGSESGRVSHDESYPCTKRHSGLQRLESTLSIFAQYFRRASSLQSLHAYTLSFKKLMEWLCQTAVNY